MPGSQHGRSLASPKIKLDTLLPHVWGTEECSASAKKSRIRTLKEAVQAIAGLPGWVCWLNDADRMVRVRKPGLWAVLMKTL